MIKHLLSLNSLQTRIGKLLVNQNILKWLCLPLSGIFLNKILDFPNPLTLWAHISLRYTLSPPGLFWAGLFPHQLLWVLNPEIVFDLTLHLCFCLYSWLRNRFTFKGNEREWILLKYFLYSTLIWDFDSELIF